MRLLLKPGTLCVAKGRVVEIDGPSSLSDMLVRDYASGEMLTVPIRCLEPTPKAPKTSADPGFIPKLEWDRCAELAKSLRPFENCARIPTEEIQKIAKKNKLSVRQVQRIRAQFQRNPRPSGLVRDPGGRREGTNLLDPKVDAVVKDVIRKFYFKRERASKESVVRKAKSAVRRLLKVKEPSRTAILIRIGQMEGFECDKARFGAKKAKQKWQARPGGLDIKRPLELLQIDHTPADVMVVTDDRLTELGRPWVTLAIDVATRCIMGFYVSMDAPSAVSVSFCIEHCVLAKKQNERYPGIWPMYGLPKRILVDNGKDFRSMAMERGCAEHGIELSFRPVRTPHYGAHIERLVGSVMQLTHELPGTTMSNSKERGDYDSAKHARMTLEEFEEWLVQKICREYHTRNHRSLGIAPLIAWERGLTNEQGALESPPMLRNPLEFQIAFLPRDFRKMSPQGIRWGSSIYWHEDLKPLVGHADDVCIHYNPRAPGCIWVRRPDGLLVTAPATKGPALGMPAQRTAVDEQTRKRLDDEIDKGYEVTDKLVDEATRKTEAARREVRGGKRGRVREKNTTLPMFGDTLPPPPVNSSMNSQTWT